MSARPLTEDELLILLRIVQTFELSYLTDDPERTVEQMQRRLERSLQEHGGGLAPGSETRERLYRLGIRIRQAFGEELTDDGSPKAGQDQQR